MKISDTTLTITYDIEGDLLQFSQSTFQHSTLKMSLIDIKEDTQSGETTIEFNDFKELEDCINDFKLKFNNLINKKNVKNRSKSNSR